MKNSKQYYSAFGNTKCGVILEGLINNNLDKNDRRKVRRLYQKWMWVVDSLKYTQHITFKKFLLNALISQLQITIYSDLSLDSFIVGSNYEILDRLFYCIRSQLVKAAK